MAAASQSVEVGLDLAQHQVMADTGDGSQKGHGVETSRSADAAPKGLLQPAHTALAQATYPRCQRRKSGARRLPSRGRPTSCSGVSTAERSMSKLAVSVSRPFPELPCRVPLSPATTGPASWQEIGAPHRAREGVHEQKAPPPDAKTGRS